MKRKHKDGMIAMGLKIHGLEGLSRDQYVKINDAKQEITNIQRTLKLHGEAHMAQDLLPQFRELVKQVDMHLSRLAAHDESIEALSETVDQLSTCKCEAGNQMLKRIAELERAVYNSPFSKVVMEDYAEKIRTFELKMKEQRGDYHDHIRQLVEENEEAHLAFLKTIPDVEILKTQVQGLEDDRKALFPHTHTPTDDKIDFVANQVKNLVRPVDTLKIQMHNLIPVHNNMMDEILKQKAFLDKVQSILDRERDNRIKKTPGYKKEITAMKMDANAPKDATGRSGFSMEKHVDMMVKKGRPRKP